MNCVINDLQFDFRQNIQNLHFTNKTTSQLDCGSFTCPIFADPQKAFDTLYHDNFIQKLDQYDSRGVPNNWFSSYLQNRLQYASIDGFKVDLEHIHCRALRFYSRTTFLKDLYELSAQILLSS